MRRFGVMRMALGAVLVMTGAAAAQDGYLIKAGDVLRIEVLEDESLNRAALVAPDGRISLPLAGAIRAQGRSVEDVQADLAARLAGNFAAPPNVYVSIERLAEPRARTGGPAVAPTIEIFVMGEVAKPGKLGVAPGTTVLQLFAEMGGFSKFAATKRIQLRRTDAAGTETSYRIDYEAIEQGTSQQGQTVLSAGDVILVPQRRLFE